MQIMRGVKISAAGSEQTLVKPVQIAETAKNESLPVDLTAKSREEEVATNLPLAAARNGKKEDPLFSSDFWVFE
jgi:hypothetical protein